MHREGQPPEIVEGADGARVRQTRGREAPPIEWIVRQHLGQQRLQPGELVLAEPTSIEALK